MMKRFILCLCAAALMTGGLACKKKQPEKAEPFANAPLETVLEKIYAEANLELPELNTTAITQENAAYYLGTDGVTFTEAIASEPLINVIPYSLCLVRVTDAAEAEEAAKAMQENADPNKWICVGVSSDEVMTERAGDVVMLVMAEQADALTAAFRKLAGQD